MKSVDDWLDQYGANHRNPTNERIHWGAVPVVTFSLIGLLGYVQIPGTADWLNGATLLVVLATLYYLALSWKLALGMGLVGTGLLNAAHGLARLPLAVWQSSLVLFTAAWIAQLCGHKVEGKKPSFIQDVQFLLIGPLWLLARIYRRLGIHY